MVRIISQETFNEAVKENMEEFSLSPEEAVEETVQQFEAQGVDLSLVVKEFASSSVHESEELAIAKLMHDLGANLKYPTKRKEKIMDNLIAIKGGCDKSLAHKIIFGNNGAYSVVLAVLETRDVDKELTVPAFDCLISLMNGQPGLLNQRGINVMLKYLSSEEDAATHQQVMKWAKVCCTKHEENRQNIFNNNILDYLKPFLDHHTTTASLVSDACGLILALVQDDDVTVEFGKAHEHARIMATEVLRTITGLLKKFRGNSETVGDVLLTLTALVVRNEFCEEVENSGGVKFLLHVFTKYLGNEKVIRLSLKLMKALAGNDDVKRRIIKCGAAPLITESMRTHLCSESVIAAGCLCISALTLRNPENSKELNAAGAAEIIVEGMKVHKNSVKVQKQSSWAIRNMVSRERSLVPVFLDLGAEDLLNLALEVHGEFCDYDARAALRDLGCQVQLTELWTGKGGALN